MLLPMGNLQQTHTKRPAFVATLICTVLQEGCSGLCQNQMRHQVERLCHIIARYCNAQIAHQFSFQGMPKRSAALSPVLEPWRGSSTWRFLDARERCSGGSIQSSFSSELELLECVGDQSCW